MNTQNIQQMISDASKGQGVSPHELKSRRIDHEQLNRARIEYENQFGPRSFPEQAYLDSKNYYEKSGVPIAGEDISQDQRIAMQEQMQAPQFNPFEESLRIEPGAVVSQEKLQAQYPEGGIGGGYQSNLSYLSGSPMAGNPVALAQQQAMFEQMNPGAQGLLSGTTEIPTSNPTDVFGYKQFGNHPSFQRGLLDQDFLRQESDAVIGVDELKAQDNSGWNKDETFNNKRNKLLREYLKEMSLNITKENEFYN